MRYFGDVDLTDGCHSLFRIDTDRRATRGSAAFAAGPADVWGVDGWTSSQHAQHAITAWMTEYGEIHAEKAAQAMADVLQVRGVSAVEIAVILQRKGIVLSDKPEPGGASLASSLGLPNDPNAAGGESFSEPDCPSGLDIVYAIDSPGFCGVLFAERATAKFAADKCRAVTGSSTWGEFRRAWPDDYFNKNREDDPPEEAPFLRADLPDLGEGFDEEPWPPDAVVSWFPIDLIEKYAGKVRYTPEGSDLFLPAEKADEIAADLRAGGNDVEKSVDDLPAWIAYWH